jgi:hypothetical protein
MDAPRVYAVRLRMPAEHCSVSLGILRRLGGSTFYTREFDSTDCHEEPKNRMHEVVSCIHENIDVPRRQDVRSALA